MIKILIDIEEGGYSTLVLDDYLEKVDSKKDRALITEIVYGVLRWRAKIDYQINLFAKNDINSLDDAVLQGLRIGIYQMQYLDRVPERAAIYETVEAVKEVMGEKERGAAGFVNAILRTVQRQKDKIEYPAKEKNLLKYLAVVYSHPEWLVRHWLELYGEDITEQLLIANNERQTVTIRLNTLVMTEKELIESLKSENVIVKKTAEDNFFQVSNFDHIENLQAYQAGGFYVQGLAAGQPAHMLEVEPGMRVLDLAAAPGGKTTQLAELMQNQGEVIAVDIYQNKLDIIKENCDRLGISIVKTERADARDYISEDKFSRILLDAPCSGFGLIAQKPDIKWRRSLEDVIELAAIQQEMLENAFSLLTPGGKLIYSTCTLTSQENWEVLQNFVEDHHTEIKIEEVKEIFPHGSGTEGFFISKISKLET